MYCRSCGNQMDPNSNFCTKCGSNQNRTNDNQLSQNNGKKVSIGSCIGICIVTAIILFIGFFILKIAIVLITGDSINENLNYILSLIHIYLPILIIIFGPIILYLIRSNKINNP